MKIGLVCPYNVNKHGGVLEVVLALKDGLETRGHKVKILTPLPNGHQSNGEKDIIFIGTSTDFRSPAATTSQVSSTVDNDQVDAIFAREKFDILHFHEPWVPLLSRQLLQRSSSVNIATFHSKVPEAMMTRTVIRIVTPYLKSVMKYLHELTAVSPAGAEYAAGLTDKHITIIPNGIDLNKYKLSRIPKPRDQLTILYIGRLERRKGVKYLLEAYQRLEHDDSHVQLIIAGDGPERERLEMLRDDLKLRNVEFLGYVSEERKLELLNRAALFCSPAVFGESFGIVLLEAMATGKVCVAGNNSGYIDVMKDLGAISIVNPHDREEFARRLKLLLYDEPLRELWRKWALHYVKQYNYPNIVDQYEELYKEALKTHGR
jgi:phosphatidylinositol alpha-mannosyltransferase